MTTTDDACAGAHYGEHDRRMADWYDLRPSRAHECLRVVLGKRCVAHNWMRARGGLNYDCLCLTVQQPHPWAFDHVRIWLDGAGRYVLTTEPYNHTPQRIDEFTVEMAELGITVTVGDRSPWYPGSTTLLLLTAQAGQKAEQKPWGSGPAPAHNCHVCGRRIGPRGVHFIFDDKVLMCGKCADWPIGGRGSAVVAHDARYPDCPAKGRHDMWDHFICSATRDRAWYVLNGRYHEVWQ